MDIGDVKKDSSSEPRNVFQRLLSFLFSSSDPEKEKRKQLKEIAKQLSRHRFKFYKPKGEEALPGFAKFIYSIYKVLSAAQVFLEHADSSSVLKSIIIESYLTKEQLAIKEFISEEKLKERSLKIDVKTLSSELKDKLISFYSAFDIEKVKHINGMYNLMESFWQVINLPERDFVYTPKFESINAEYIVNDIKDLLEVLPLLEQNTDWDNLFNILKEYKKNDVVSRHNWKKTIKLINDVIKSSVMVLMVRHIEKKPGFRMKTFPPKDKIVEEYLSRLKTQSELIMQKIIKERKEGKVNELLKQIFNTTAISRVKFYTEKANLSFSKKMLGGYVHVASLNYLKAFLLDFIKKDIKEIVDILLIRGTWTTNLLSQQLSDSFHNLIGISDELVRFDESLSEEGDLGIKVKNSIHLVDRDKTRMKQLRTLLKKINDEAAAIIQNAGNNIIIVGKNLKSALDDYSREHHELIINWNEIDTATDGHVKQLIVDVYKKIYLFIQLIKITKK